MSGSHALFNVLLVVSFRFCSYNFTIFHLFRSMWVHFVYCSIHPGWERFIESILDLMFVQHNDHFLNFGHFFTIFSIFLISFIYSFAIILNGKYGPHKQLCYMYIPYRMIVHTYF